eukprot:6478096-Prorocentrum_lima.AAC.1
MSMGGADLLTQIQEFYAGYGVQLASRLALPLRFSFADGAEDESTSVLTVPFRPWRPRRAPWPNERHL